MQTKFYTKTRDNVVQFHDNAQRAVAAAENIFNDRYVYRSDTGDRWPVVNNRVGDLNESLDSFVARVQSGRG